MPKAARLAEELLNTFAARLEAVVLVPSSGGVFEVTAGGRTVFSKRAAGRFPRAGGSRAHPNGQQAAPLKPGQRREGALW